MLSAWGSCGTRSVFGQKVAGLVPGVKVTLSVHLFLTDESFLTAWMQKIIKRLISHHRKWMKAVMDPTLLVPVSSGVTGILYICGKSLGNVLNFYSSAHIAGSNWICASTLFWLFGKAAFLGSCREQVFVRLKLLVFTTSGWLFPLQLIGSCCFVILQSAVQSSHSCYS